MAFSGGYSPLLAAAALGVAILSGNVGVATETDTASALARIKAKPVGLATETDTASARTRTTVKATGLASETDSGYTLARVHIRVAGRADETDAASALVGTQAYPLGFQSLFPYVGALTHAGGVDATASETDTATALPHARLRVVGTAAEADTSSALARLKTAFAGERLNDADGVRVDFADGWVHLRASNTEPIARVIAEAPTRERARELIALCSNAAGL